MIIKKWWTDFRKWQRTPYVPAPLTQNQHVCVNCSESFDGDYCPRCGQKGNTKRLTLKNVLTSALDVWGAGNHSMLRNIIHLTFRPGYMIGDYLKGHRQPYFPPFKMLFIFVTVFLIFVSGVRWSMGIKPEESKIHQVDHALEKGLDNAEERTLKDVAREVDKEDIGEAAEDLKEAKNRIQWSKNKEFSAKDIKESLVYQSFRKSLLWISDNRALSILAWQLIVAVSVWLLFRRSPRMGKLSLSEQFFVQVFISSQIILFSFIFYVCSLPWVPGGEDDFPGDLMLLTYYFDYKQLFGFGWWKTLWRSLLVMLMIGLVILVLCGVFVLLMGVEYGVKDAL